MAEGNEVRLGMHELGLDGIIALDLYSPTKFRVFTDIQKAGEANYTNHLGIGQWLASGRHLDHKDGRVVMPIHLSPKEIPEGTLGALFRGSYFVEDDWEEVIVSASFLNQPPVIKPEIQYVDRIVPGPTTTIYQRDGKTSFQTHWEGTRRELCKPIGPPI